MKLIRNTVIILLSTLLLFWVGYNIILPKLAAETISTGEVSPLIPEKYRSALQKARSKADTVFKELPQFMTNHSLTYDELVIIVNSTTSDEIIPLVTELKNNPEEGPDKVFDRVVNYLGDKVEDPEMFRDVFLEKFDRKRLNAGLKFLEDSDMPLESNIDFGRKVILEVLRDRREEIEDQLKRIQTDS